MSWFKPASWYDRQAGRPSLRGYISRDGDFTKNQKEAERSTDREEAEGMRSGFTASFPKEEFNLVELEDSSMPRYNECLTELAKERKNLAKSHQELVDFLPKRKHAFYGAVLTDKQEDIVLARRRVRDRIDSANTQLEFRQRKGFGLDLKPEVPSTDEADTSGNVSSEGVGWEGAENDWHYS